MARAISLTAAAQYSLTILMSILVQFDGSAHRSRQIEGAGAALLQVESTGVPYWIGGRPT